MHSISLKLTQKTLTGLTKKNRRKQKGEQVKKRNDEHVTKKQKKLFYEKVERVHMDLLQCDSSMISFNFKELDTLGYLEEISNRNLPSARLPGVERNATT